MPKRKGPELSLKHGPRVGDAREVQDVNASVMADMASSSCSSGASPNPAVSAASTIKVVERKREQAAPSSASHQAGPLPGRDVHNSSFV